MAGKLWDKGYEPDKMIEEYTVGDDRELDMRLARYDVEGSLAHIAMLETIGLLTAEELEKLTAGLKEIAAEIEAGRFEIEPGTEDVHSQVELMLTRRLGDAGKKIHSGRSRNDQVLVDLKLFLRDELRQVADAQRKTGSRYVRDRVMNDVPGQSNGESAFLFFDPVCLSDFYLLFLSEKASLYTSLSIHTHTDV